MLEITIDWLQFTSNTKSHLNTIIQVLQQDVNSYQKLDKGKLGYKKQLHSQGIFILYEGNEDMNCHVIITGEGCKYYSINNNLLELIERMNKYECKATRIDLAIDDKQGNIIPLENLTEDIRKANVVSKWKTSLEMTKRSLENGETLGKTINLGSRSSQVFMRIYNKSLEQAIPGNWTRMELEIKKDRAVVLQEKITKENVGYLTITILNNYFRIVEPSSTDTNKRRWKTAEYWSNIVETTEKTQLSVDTDVTTLEEMKEWIEKQIAPSIATIVMADGGSTDFLYEQIELGIKRLKSKHYALINKAMAEGENENE